MTQPTNKVSLEVADSNRMSWETLTVSQIGAEIPFKSLFADPDTGMQVMLLRYAAGFTNTWHTHPCAHGMYVLDGILKTHEGEYGPGNWVWFPEGGWMEHGATEDNDVTFLFVTNKPFAICYESDSDHPYPMAVTAD
ncbi:cupin domain-containing protein [Rhodococcoides fascians]|jgi:quercetin dioxygenase-like cupin family protein|uniref:cupin domain-containing protein n=1 Tax=Rhodococcoides fascians TaxID=1828 RepID=UPI00050CCB38|nr:cupin domain-containing protein [Rhodococcus fascians]